MHCNCHTEVGSNICVNLPASNWFSCLCSPSPKTNYRTDSRHREGERPETSDQESGQWEGEDGENGPDVSHSVPLHLSYLQCGVLGGLPVRGSQGDR